MSRPLSPRTVRLHADDNVVVAVDTVDVGASAGGVEARQRVPRGGPKRRAEGEEGGG